MANQEEEYNSKTQLEIVSAKLEQPDKFAQIFCQAAKSQKSIDGVLATVIKRLIKEDVQVIKLIKSYQRQVNKEDLLSFINKIGFTGYTIIVAVVTAIIIAIVKKFI